MLLAFENYFGNTKARKSWYERLDSVWRQLKELRVPDLHVTAATQTIGLLKVFSGPRLFSLRFFVVASLFSVVAVNLVKYVVWLTHTELIEFDNYFHSLPLYPTYLINIVFDLLTVISSVFVLLAIVHLKNAWSIVLVLCDLAIAIFLFAVCHSALQWAQLDRMQKNVPFASALVEPNSMDYSLSKQVVTDLTVRFTDFDETTESMDSAATRIHFLSLFENVSGLALPFEHEFTVFSRPNVLTQPITSPAFLYRNLGRSDLACRYYISRLGDDWFSNDHSYEREHFGTEIFDFDAFSKGVVEEVDPVNMGTLLCGENIEKIAADVRLDLEEMKRTSISVGHASFTPKELYGLSLGDRLLLYEANSFLCSDLFSCADSSWISFRDSLSELLYQMAGSSELSSSFENTRGEIVRLRLPLLENLSDWISPDEVWDFTLRGFGDGPKSPNPTEWVLRPYPFYITLGGRSLYGNYSSLLMASSVMVPTLLFLFSLLLFIIAKLTVSFVMAVVRVHFRYVLRHEVEDSPTNFRPFSNTALFVLVTYTILKKFYEQLIS